MQIIVIPLIIIMLSSFILYTISMINIHSTSVVGKKNIAFIHSSLALFIIGMIYMVCISLKLPYHHVSYLMMNIHECIGCITFIALLIHAIFGTIVKRKGSTLLSKGKILNIFLWIIYVIGFIISLYIGILASLK